VAGVLSVIDPLGLDDHESAGIRTVHVQLLWDALPILSHVAPSPRNAPPPTTHRPSGY